MFLNDGFSDYSDRIFPTLLKSSERRPPIRNLKFEISFQYAFENNLKKFSVVF